jgi:hypothetical protein
LRNTLGRDRHRAASSLLATTFVANRIADQIKRGSTMDTALASSSSSIDVAPMSLEEGAPTPRPRGFATLSIERRRAIASQGGKAAHARGVAHKFSGETARTAGQKGGIAISRDLDYMATIGRRGGLARGETLRQNG